MTKYYKKTYYRSREDRNLFKSNLDNNINDQKIIQAFSKNDRVQCSSKGRNIIVKNSGFIYVFQVMRSCSRSKDYGFVCFSTSDEAIKHMSEKILGSKSVFVILNRAPRTTQISSHYQYEQKSTSAALFC